MIRLSIGDFQRMQDELAYLRVRVFDLEAVLKDHTPGTGSPSPRPRLDPHPAPGTACTCPNCCPAKYADLITREEHTHLLATDTDHTPGTEWPSSRWLEAYDALRRRLTQVEHERDQAHARAVIVEGERITEAIETRCPGLDWNPSDGLDSADPADHLVANINAILERLALLEQIVALAQDWKRALVALEDGTQDLVEVDRRAESAVKALFAALPDPPPSTTRVPHPPAPTPGADVDQPF